MLFSDMTTFVRTVADTDEEDAPDSTLEVYARMAYYDIRRRIQTWPHLRTSTTLTTTGSTGSYDLSALPTPLQYVESVIGDTHKVEYADLDTVQRWNEGVGVDHETLEADWWTEQSGTLILYPTPSAGGETYTVRGYRQFADFPSGNNEPDLPDEFHPAICQYMLARFYSAQEDLELAARYIQDYELMVNRQIEGALRGSVTVSRPLIFGGARRANPTYNSWVRRNVEG
jgi:hypothetical protein